MHNQGCGWAEVRSNIGRIGGRIRRGEGKLGNSVVLPVRDEGTLEVGLVDAHVSPVVPALCWIMGVWRSPTLFLGSPFRLEIARLFRVIFVVMFEREAGADGEIAARASSVRVPRAEEDVRLRVDLMFLRYLYPARANAWDKLSKCMMGGCYHDIPSGRAVTVFPTSSISMLVILIGFARLSTSRPRTMPGGASAWRFLCRPVASPARRKTTDSARRMSREVLCGCAFAVEGIEEEGVGVGRKGEERCKCKLPATVLQADRGSRYSEYSLFDFSGPNPCLLGLGLAYCVTSGDDDPALECCAVP